MENQDVCPPERSCIDRLTGVCLRLRLYIHKSFPQISSHPLFTIRRAIIIVIAICRGAGKYACASSCNVETTFSAGRFSDRSITVEIALSSTGTSVEDEWGGWSPLTLHRRRFFLSPFACTSRYYFVEYLASCSERSISPEISLDFNWLESL